MTHHMKKHAGALLLMKKSNPKLRNELIKIADRDLMYALCDCALNVLNGKIKLKPKQRRQIAKFCRHLQYLTNKKTPLKQKRRVLQSGGFLPALLGVLAPVLGKLLLS